VTASQVNQVDLNASDPTVVQFKAAWAIGRAIQQNLRALSLAADRTFEPNWAQAIAEFSRFIDGFATSTEKNIQVYLSSFQHSVRGWVELYRGDNTELGKVVDEVLTAVRPFSTDELQQHLSALASEGKKLMNLCVQNWGGQEARKRLLEVQDASLEIVTEVSAKRTWLFANSATGATKISLRAGVGESTLTDYISLPFYYFHEYLSHVFSQWDDLPGTFSEGMLFALEKQFFEGWCHTVEGGFASLSDIVLNDVVIDMKNHRARLIPKPRSDGDYGAAVERMVPWLQKQFGESYLNTLLLETAGITTPYKSSLQQEFISALGYLHRNDKVEALQQFHGSPGTNLNDVLEQIESNLPEINDLFGYKK
jgi:hypothetical protein